MEKLNTDALWVCENDEYTSYTFAEDKPTILCGIPAAFTPGCTHKHLAGFVKNIGKFANYNIVFVSVNDPSVMHAWNELHGHPDILPIADPLATFTQQYGYDHDYGVTMGIRSRRYALLVVGGVVINEFKSPFADGVLAELLQ